jgi:hypothetical protein
MSAVKDHAAAAEEMRYDLMQIATETGAIKMDEEGEHFISCYRADAESHAYALATIRSDASDASGMPTLKRFGRP